MQVRDLYHLRPGGSTGRKQGGCRDLCGSRAGLLSKGWMSWGHMDTEVYMSPSPG